MSNPIFTESNVRIAALPGIQACDYSAKEARLALAIQDAGITAGGGTVLDNTNPVVTTADSIILPTESARSYFLIQNLDGTNSVFLNFNVAASTTNGFRLAPGESKEFVSSLFATAEVHAVTDAGTAQVVIFATEV